MSDKEVNYFLDTSIKFLSKKLKLHPGTKIARIESFNEIQETLEKFLGKGSYILLFRFGEMNADDMLKDKIVQTKLDNINDFMNRIISLAEDCNWFRLRDLDIKKTSITITIDSSFEAIRHSKVDFCVCSFLSGFFSRVVNYFYKDSRYMCKELKCIARGDEACVFKIKKS